MNWISSRYFPASLNKSPVSISCVSLYQGNLNVNVPTLDVRGLKKTIIQTAAKILHILVSLQAPLAF
jgi:hypothetical protein